jgi:hypothetical protein
VNKGSLQLVEIILQSTESDSNDHVVSAGAGGSPSTVSSDSGYMGSGETERRTSRPVHKLDIDSPNRKCMNATALHLAVWNEFDEIAIRLVQAGADPYLKMNEATSAIDMAKESQNETLHELLVEYAALAVAAGRRAVTKLL